MIVYGGDWNPEQWPEETWAEDVALMREAGVNRVSLGIFSWSMLEPVEGVFEFGWLDRCMDLLAANGIQACLATPTAAPPPWFGATYPQALPVDADGRVLYHGSRQAFCPSSPIYREKALRIAEQVGHRYAQHPALSIWHVHNEYGCHITRCFCDASASAFRAWLCERYQSLDALNEAWGTAFWSQRYSDWSQILPPRATPALSNPGQQLDFHRFSSDALLELYRAERDLLVELAPGVPATTNLMAGMHWEMDYFSYGPELDVVANDHYLIGEDPHIHLAFSADLARSIGKGKPWVLMEHSTSAVNWQGCNRAKRPGELIRNSVQHLARGADGIMFFQWRASRAGAEKWHSAMLPHVGTDTKIWREVVRLGSLLRALGDVAGSTVTAEAAVLLDYASIWAQDHPAQPTNRHQPIEIIRQWYGELWKLGVTCDIVHPEADLSGYRLVVVPALYLVSDQGAATVERFVEQGGTVLIAPYSGIVDERDQIRLGGYPGAWRELLGLTVEEFFPLAEGETVTLAGGGTGTIWSEVAHPTTAKVMDSLTTGEPAWTRNEWGAGTAHYLTTLLAGDDLARVMAEVCTDAGVSTTSAPGLELVRRTHLDGRAYLFAINHTDTDQTTGELVVPAGEVRIVEPAK